MFSFISKHKILSTGIVLAVIVVSTAAIIAFYDEAPPDDKDFIPKMAAMPSNDDNAAFTLRSLPKKRYTLYAHFPEASGQITKEEWPSFCDGKIKCPKVRALWIERNSETIRVLFEASKKNSMQHDLRYLNSVSYPTESPIITYIESVGLLSIFFRDDNLTFREEAMTDALNILYMARRYTIADGIGASSIIPGTSTEAKITILISEAIATTSDRKLCIQTAHALALHQYDVHTAYSGIMREEYALLETYIKDDPDWNTLTGKYVYKINNTKRLALDVIKEAIECSAKGESKIHGTLVSQAKVDNEGSTYREFHAKIRPNSGGIRVYSAVGVRASWVYERLLNVQTMANLARCGFAMRAYWLDHGVLPDSLEGLVPEYLPSVPLDLYSRKPLLYNKGKFLIYSAGLDLVDDNGDFAFERYAEPWGWRPFMILRWAMPD